VCDIGGAVRTPDILAVHVMKTAGTSLRRMLVDGLGAAAVYPNDDDLARLPKRWYPSPSKLVEDVQGGRHHDARLVIGHVPFVLVDALPRRPLTVTLLREPVARTVSMMEHRRRSTKRFRGASYADLLADDAFVDGQLRDYQTKVFAFDRLEECRDHVNVPLVVHGGRLERALGRLGSVDVLGVVEQLPAFVERFERVTGVAPGQERTSNRAPGEREPLDAGTRARIEELTVHDRILYDRALELVAAPPGRSGWRGLRSRLRTHLGHARRGS
jgi:hypothetical protein